MLGLCLTLTVAAPFEKEKKNNNTRSPDDAESPSTHINKEDDSSFSYRTSPATPCAARTETNQRKDVQSERPFFPGSPT